MNAPSARGVAPILSARIALLAHDRVQSAAPLCHLSVSHEDALEPDRQELSAPGTRHAAEAVAAAHPSRGANRSSAVYAISETMPSKSSPADGIASHDSDSLGLLMVMLKERGTREGLVIWIGSWILAFGVGGLVALVVI